LSTERDTQTDEWWEFEPPTTPYDLVSNNLFTRMLRPFLYIGIRFYFRHFHTVRISGFKPEFSRRPFIIVANHASHLDTPLIFSCFALSGLNKIRAVAALDYFFSNPVLRIATHLLCNIIPISRKSADFMAIGMCKKALERGGSIIIFPEGTRTRTGAMAEFKPGIGILIKKTKAAVLPTYIKGTFRCFNSKSFYPKPGPIEIRFGKPIEYLQLLDGAPDRHGIAERLQTEVQKLAQEMR
jgi:1-acyl-sn-glycerol-3-phosphate acyltransferase